MLVVKEVKTLVPVIPVPKHALPSFPQSLGPRGKLGRYKPSHKEQVEEGKYSPRRLGEEFQHTSSLPTQKKKAIWGLYHTKIVPLDLRKRPRCPVWGGGTGKLRARLYP